MKNKEQKLLEQAEKNGLFNDIICDDCDRTFDINWRNCIYLINVLFVVVLIFLVGML